MGTSEGIDLEKLAKCLAAGAAFVYAMGHVAVMLYAMYQRREITPVGKLGRYKFCQPSSDK
jgi:hypothetical protein